MKKSVLLTICMLVLIMFMQACGSGNKNMAGLDAGYNDAGYNGYYENAPDGAYRYDEVKEGGFVAAEVKNTSTFSLDRNTTGYSLARRQIGGGLKIVENSVRIEEYVNYFSYDYEKPQGDSPLAISGSLSDCPWINLVPLMLSIAAVLLLLQLITLRPVSMTTTAKYSAARKSNEKIMLNKNPNKP